VTGVHDCPTSAVCTSLDISVLVPHFDATEMKVYSLEVRELRHQIEKQQTQKSFSTLLRKQVRRGACTFVGNWADR
jgi:hypothetical protein